MKGKIKILDVIIVLLFFSVIKIAVVPQIVQQAFKFFSLFVILIYLLNKGKIVFGAGTWLALIWAISSVFSFLTGNIQIRTLLDGILNSICIFCIFGVVNYAVKKGRTKELLSVLWNSTFVASILSLVSVIFSNGDKIGAADIYFFGNKYATCYILLFFTALSYYRFYDEKRQKNSAPVLYGSLIAIAIAVAAYVKCSTALVGGFFMILSLFPPGKRKKAMQSVMEKPIMALFYTIAPCFLAMNAAVLIASNSILRDFITVYLGKSAGMTGRVYIYSRLLEIFRTHPLWGYGYNSNIVQIITEVGNSQNGLMELLISYGIIGVICFVTICYFAFKNSEGAKELWGIKIFIIQMCVCAIVEISYNYLFLLAAFILYSQGHRQKRSKFRLRGYNGYGTR